MLLTALSTLFKILNARKLIFEILSYESEKENYKRLTLIHH